MYNIEFSSTAEKQFFKLEKKIQERIIAVLERIKVNPKPHISRLVGSPYYKSRVGDYRVVLKLMLDEQIILIVEMGHRKNIYDKL